MYQVILFLSYILTGVFFLYGFNHYYLLKAARKYRAPESPARDAPQPRVAFHLPIYNEKYVIGRLVDACIRATETYGKDFVEILILDDSDDDTVQVVDGLVRAYRDDGFDIKALRRASRRGYKAGALQAALEQSEVADYVAIFDADFTPAPDFLQRTIPHFLEDEGLGIIQSRWTHINRDYNFLTRAISIGIDVHFLVEQSGRYAAGCFQNFNGSGGIIRTAALRAAGGWQTDTLAEDLDISYRVQEAGYRVLYLNDLPSPGEVPPSVPSFKRQQGRWACGSLRTARKLLPVVLGDPSLSFKVRLQSLIHLTGYMVHPLMFTSFLLAILASLFNVDSFRIADLNFINAYGTGLDAIQGDFWLLFQSLGWLALGSLIVLCSVAAWVSPVASLRAQKLPVARNLGSLLVLYLLGTGISLSNTIEAGKALLTNRRWAFQRTPKYAVRDRLEGWREKRYQVPLDYVALLELLFVSLGLLSILAAVSHRNYGLLLILAPYTLAYAFIFTFTLAQSRADAA